MSLGTLYRVQPGDTLAKIAARHNVSVEQLMQANPGVSNDNLILSHSYLRIPSPISRSDVYIVRQGDTLSSIAAKHGTTVDEILQTNPQIKDPNKIYAGYELKMPSRQPKKKKPSIGGGIFIPPIIIPTGKQTPPVPSTPKGPVLIPLPPTETGTGQPPQIPETPIPPVPPIPEPKGTEPPIPPVSPPTEPKGKKTEPIKEEPEQEQPEQEKPEQPPPEEKVEKEQLPATTDEECEECIKECSVLIGCKHNGRIYDKLPPYYAVVPDTKKKNKLGYYFDQLNVRVDGSNAPDTITFGSESQKTKGRDIGGKLFEIDVPYTSHVKWHERYSIIELSKMLQPPVEDYMLSGECIGQLPIKVHSPDVWELKIGFPTWASIEVGRKTYGSIRSANSRDEVLYSDIRHGRETERQEVHRDNVTGTSGIRAPEIGNSYPVGISLKCNNAQRKLKSLEALHEVLTTGANIQDVFQKIQTVLRPKWGVYTQCH